MFSVVTDIPTLTAGDIIKTAISSRLLTTSITATTEEMRHDIGRMPEKHYVQLGKQVNMGNMGNHK